MKAYDVSDVIDVLDVLDVAVLGAGPAGLAAGLSSHRHGADTLIIERENKPGGVLKQCIHDGFGLVRFKEKLTGPEYAGRYIKMVEDEGIPLLTSTFVSGMERIGGHFRLTLVNEAEGIFKVESKALMLANGCRERTSKQASIHGTRPAGIFTAGTAQYFVNILGYLPCKKCVILGSGDIGLIMARRLTLEGAEVLGVYEAKSAPSGLSRNIAQCLEDYGIPLYLSHTVTRVFGDERVEGAEICQVDDFMNPIPGTETRVACDGIILSVGLIPENESAEALGVPLDSRTKGPWVDQNLMTLQQGVFCCGNALHVNDLVDYVSESGELAGACAAAFVHKATTRTLVEIACQAENFLYCVPQYFDIHSSNTQATLYFRSRQIERDVRVQIRHNGRILFTRKYPSLKPPETERAVIDLKDALFNTSDRIDVVMLKGE